MIFEHFAQLTIRVAKRLALARGRPLGRQQGRGVNCESSAEAILTRREGYEGGARHLGRSGCAGRASRITVWSKCSKNMKPLENHEIHRKSMILHQKPKSGRCSKTVGIARSSLGRTAQTLGGVLDESKGARKSFWRVFWDF